MLAMFLLPNQWEGEEALKMFMRGMVLLIVLTTTGEKPSLRPELIHHNSIAITVMSPDILPLSVLPRSKTHHVLLVMRGVV